MIRNHRILLTVALLIVTAPLMVNAQTSKPALKKPAPRKPATSIVPIGTNLKIRLNESLSSKESRIGDRFTATAIDPVRFNEAVVHGHVRSIQKSGTVKGRTTMNLAFDSIEVPGDPPKSGVMHGYVTRVYGANAKTDQEGGVQSEGRGNQTLKRSGIGATAGAIIGGIAGGGKGAGIGLLVGGAGGAGSLAIKGSKELKLESGTEMLVRVTR